MEGGSQCVVGNIDMNLKFIFLQSLELGPYGFDDGRGCCGFPKLYVILGSMLECDMGEHIQIIISTSKMTTPGIF